MALNRVTPNLRPDQYRTFAVVAPLATHFRPATCEEAGCPAFLGGWRSTVDLSTDLGQAQAAYIRGSGRGVTEPEPGVFEFAPGQPCFRADQHRARIDRPDLFVVRDGDHRWSANPQQLSADSWVDVFRTHQDNLAAAAG